MAAAKSRRSTAQEDESNSILSRLVGELEESEMSQDTGSDVTVLFCGEKKAGKTALIDRYIKPDKDDKDVPKPTVALDYKYARYAAADASGSSKVLAHIYDLSGIEQNASDVLAIPVSAASSSNLVLALVLDLSEPQTIVSTLDRWLGQLRAQASKSLAALAKESPKRAQAVQAARHATFEGHADSSMINAFPVPIVIFGAKWDVLAAPEMPADKRKCLCKALRYLAHANGASLVFTSLKDKTAMNNMRALLRLLLFGVQPSKGMPEQLDPSKPLCVLAGKDSFANIGGPRGGQASHQEWANALLAEFPETHASAVKGGKRSSTDEVGQVAEDLVKFAESSVDGTVEQRQEELVAYRKQAERNQRLASEGVDGAKGILAS